MKRAITTLTSILVTITMYGQVTIGGAIGILSSKSDIKSEDVDELLGKSYRKGGVKFGVYADIKLAKGLFATPMINFVSKGSKSKKNYDEQLGDVIKIVTKFSTNYIEIPLTLTYKSNDNYGFFANAGPVISYGVGGNIKARSTGIIITELTSLDTRIKFDGDKNADDEFVHYKSIEVGATVSAGYELKRGFRLQLTYNPNFTNISLDPETSYKNSYFSFVIGCRF
jgi:hypothetical protein